jgi:hypothetical protein
MIVGLKGASYPNHMGMAPASMVTSGTTWMRCTTSPACIHSHMIKDVRRCTFPTSILHRTVYTTPYGSRIKTNTPPHRYQDTQHTIIPTTAASSRLPTELPYCHSISKVHTSTGINQHMACKLLLLHRRYNFPPPNSLPRPLNT